MLARVEVDEAGRLAAGFVPCVINRRSQPEVVRRDARGAEVLEYVERISREAGLKSSFSWQDDCVAVSAG